MATLEEIQLKVDEVKSKIPGIKQGIEALSASDLSEGASAVDVPDIGDQPTTAGTVSNGAGSTADTAVAVVDAEEQRLKDEAEARQKEIDEAAKVKQNWLDKLTTTGKTSEEKLAEEEEEAGVAGLSDDAKAQKLKVAGIQGDLAKLESRYLVDVDREGDRLASSGAIGLAENKITREYKRDKAYLSADLYAEAAVLDVYSGNLTDAKNAAKDAVTAFMYDQEQEVKRFEYLYDYHSDFLDSLKAEDKAIVDEAKLKAEEEKAKVEAEKYQIMEWKMKYPNSGILLADTVEEATLKIEDQLRGQVDLLSVSEAKSLGVPYGTTRQDAMGLTPEGTTDIISQATLNKMGAAGVPNDVALTMQQDVNSGVSWDDIYNGMSATYGNVKAGQYIDKFRKIMAEQGTIQVPSLPPESYEERAEAEATTPEKEDEGGTVWWNPLTWF